MRKRENDIEKLKLDHKIASGDQKKPISEQFYRDLKEDIVGVTQTQRRPLEWRLTIAIAR
jgi:hypothetical protein